MKLSNLRKTLLASAAGLAMVWSASASASVIIPEFTLAPSVFGGAAAGQSNFTANLIAGVSSELLHTDATGGHTATGWMQISGFKYTDASGTTTILNASDTGLGTAYNLYLTYTLKDVVSSGTANTAGNENTLTQLDFKFFVDPSVSSATRDKFIDADVDLTTHVGREATVTDTTGNDVLLAYGSLVSGVAGFDSQGGAYLNSTQTFSVCTGAGTATQQGVPSAGASSCTSGLGNAFFALPQPFYGLAFDEFNNTQSATIIDPTTGLVAIRSQATGAIDFNRVPEPGSLALLGLGLLGAGLSSRRRSK